MFIGEVIAQLKSEGLPATVDKVRHADRTGRLKPAPRMNSLGIRVFTPRHLDQLRHYLTNVRPGPQPQPKQEPYPPDRHRFRRTAQTDRVDAEIDKLKELYRDFL